MNNSRFTQFKQNAKDNWSKHLEDMKGSGSFEFSQQSDKLRQLQNNLNHRLLMYLFGSENSEDIRLVDHLAEKYQGNLLTFFGQINSEMKFFILHELHTDEYLFLRSKS